MGMTPEQWAEYSQRIAHNINQYGQHLQGVFPTILAGGHHFTYTIGRHLKNQPDMLVVGIPGEVIGPVINMIGNNPLMMDTVTHAQDGDLLDLGGQYPLKMFNVGEVAKRNYTCLATSFYGIEGYRVVQLVLPDLEGRYPGDPLCKEPYSFFGNVEEQK